uniref:Rab-GAP TBC domain-containing protein n=1 Tax=Syphacia muris TaxID=451379 RepID=A0A0N5AGE6_9BILA
MPDEEQQKEQALHHVIIKGPDSMRGKLWKLSKKYYEEQRDLYKGMNICFSIKGVEDETGAIVTEDVNQEGDAGNTEGTDVHMKKIEAEAEAEEDNIQEVFINQQHITVSDVKTLTLLKVLSKSKVTSQQSRFLDNGSTPKRLNCLTNITA